MNQQYHHLAVTPLSPVHMGTDADYEPTGYVIDGGALFEFDGITALHALPRAEQQKLNRILSGKPTDQMLREVQGFFHVNRERLIARSRRQVRVNASVEAFYQSRIGKVVQHEQGGRKVQNRLEIERTAWNPVSGQPILPGSGLKGAIRTALLDEVNGGRRPERNERNRDLQHRLFGYRAGKFELDPMRLIRLGDAPLREGLDLPTEIYFALNRKKRPVEKNGTLVQSQAEQKNLYQLLECLPPLQPRAFSGSLSVQELGTVGEQGRTTPKLRFTTADIAAACNRFYRPILEAELQLLRRRGFVDAAWAGQIEALLQRLQPAFVANRAFLLRAGRHSGAESVTLNGVRHIRIMKGKGERPEHLDSAKTLWLASHERQAQRDLLPFGWLLVELDPDNHGPWQTLDTPQRERQWLTQVRERVEKLRQGAERRRRQEEAERQRREKEAAERRAEEEAARRQAEEEAARRQAEYDAMPESHKRLHRFRQAVSDIGSSAPLNKDQFGRLKGEVSALIEEARHWSEEERSQVADAIEATFEQLGWAPSGLKSDKRKKQEKKNRQLVAELRESS